MALTKEVDIRTTWCTMMGHYTRAFFDDVVAYGSEVALHYEAQTFVLTADERKPEMKQQFEAAARGRR